MAVRKALFGNDTEDAFPEEIAITDTMQLGGITLTGDIALSGGAKITGLTAGTAANDAVTFAQLNTAVINGGSVKEAVLVDAQLNTAEGMLAAAAITFEGQPAAADTITITDGTTTRTYGATSGGDLQYTIGASVADSMTNFAAAVTADGSAAWGAEFTTALQAIDTDGVVVIVEDDNDGTVSRVYATWATAANIEHVDFDTKDDYTFKTKTQLDASDPTASNPNFGARTTQASLTDGEIHLSLATDTLFSWDDSADTWQTLSGAASVVTATGASGGGVLGKATFDTDTGLSVSTGIVTINLESDGGLQFDASAKGIEVKVADANTLATTASGLDVTGVPTLFKINGTAVGSTVTAANLDTVTDGSNADALHIHTALAVTESQRLEEDLTVDAAVTAGDPVYWNTTADRVAKTTADNTNAFHSFGVVVTTEATPGNPTNVVTRGKAAGVIAAATAGDVYYLAGGSGGGVSTTKPSTSGERIVRVGYAINATDLWVDIEPIRRLA